MTSWELQESGVSWDSAFVAVIVVLMAEIAVRPADNEDIEPASRVRCCLHT